MHLSPPDDLGCCPFWGGGSVVVDFLLIDTPLVGVCCCSVFCCTLLYVHSSIAIILMGVGAGCFAWFVFLLSCGGWVALPRGEIESSAV